MKLLSNIFAVLTIFLLVAVVPAKAKGLRLKFAGAIYSDDKNGKLYLPEGVTCGDDFIVVADSGNHRLVRYSIKDKAISYNSQISMPKAYPIVVHTNSAGDIFVLDGKERHIIHLGPAGENKGYLKPTNLPAPNKMEPKSFVIDQQDNIYILDIFSSRVLEVDKNGKFIRQIPFPPEIGFISDLALTPKGDVLILDSVAGTLYKAAQKSDKFLPLTEHMKDFSNFPNHLTTDDKGMIYVVDQYGNGLIIIGPDGSFQGRQSSMGWKESLVRYPSQVCSNPKNGFFVADRNNNRVQVFIPIGE